MTSTLVRSWWSVALRGLFAVIFGILALIWPGISIAALVILFGAYALADGVFAIVAAVRQRDLWWPLLLEGFAGIAAGLITFFYPGLTAIALLYLIAAWAVVTGIFEIIAAVRLRRVIRGEALLILSGIASIAFGVLVMIWPGAGALAVITIIAAYALIFGVLLIGLGFRLRAMKTPEVMGPGARVGA